MQSENRNRRLGGFAMVDLAVFMVVGVFIVAFLVISGGETRRQASLGRCMQQLRQQGVAIRSYEADNAGLIATFSWRVGDQLSQWPDLNLARDDLVAAANQAVDIIRRRTDRLDFPRITGWVPHVLYTQLVIVDYLDSELPWESAACPEDEPRRCWQARGEDFCDCPIRPDCDNYPSQRWSYSSSYEFGPTFFSEDGRLAQGPEHRYYVVLFPSHLGGKLLAQVRYPAAKAMMWEGTARHFGPKHQYHAYKEARVPILFADGSVSAKATTDANPGWHPLVPDDPRTTIYYYAPSAWEAPTLSGKDRERVTGYYRWTRRGLAGRDFGGPEVWE